MVKRKKLSNDQLAEAMERRVSGENWKVIAIDFNFNIFSLMRAVSRAKRRGMYRD